ncbi:hypothetical protein ATANTOWER_029628 [Ataeniobius toweri]|uniref:Uncharacterized protein n=1 Tax=Ataeniobius toweri TaxID=208326 RepID=A0ABU7CCY7_9TELE|nr:hypothetical protein [Ataeniobius toweri]
MASGRRAKRRGPPGLSTRVDQLSAELAQIKALLQSLRADGCRGETSPPEQGGSSNCEDDAISVPATGTLFLDSGWPLDCGDDLCGLLLAGSTPTRWRAMSLQ